MNTKNLTLAVLFIISFIFYYQITAPTTNTTTAKVTRIIDGDTLIINNKTKIRLLGINTPEKNERLYKKAKDFLISATQNQTVQIESHGTDKYSRTLAHLYKNSNNVNAQILKNGLATLFYYNHDIHYGELKEAEKSARKNSLGLWKKSPNSYCIKIIEFKTDEPEHLILQNTCSHELNITYKDDATHIYKTTIGPNEIHTKTFSHIWNTNGDSIYIYDNEGMLLFYRY